MIFFKFKYFLPLFLIYIFFVFIPQGVLAFGASNFKIEILTLCGNNMKETGEQCDGSDLGGASCASQSFSGGALSCTASCVFNTSACTSGGGGGGGAPIVNPPTINPPRTPTFKSTQTLSGTMNIGYEVWVNNSNTGVVYPVSANWSSLRSLNLGKNTFNIFAKYSGTSSKTVSATIERWMIGDTNGDNIVDDFDLAGLAAHWTFY
jgi:hypothetical protein